jgi:hypothetical protein
METVVLGKKIKNLYEVNYNWVKINNGGYYTEKPSYEKRSKVSEWVEICRYKGKPYYNHNYAPASILLPTINISEKETVTVEEQIFRADLNEAHLYTDKVVEEIDVNDEEDAKRICEEQIRLFNKMMIESNDKLKNYCDLFNLSYEDTDCIELFKVVYPSEYTYVIEKGVMKAKTYVTKYAYKNGVCTCKI